MESSSLPYQFLGKASWLNEVEHDALVYAFRLPYFTSLAIEEQNRLAPLLLSILYAEKRGKEKGKRITRILEGCLERLGIERFFCATLGIWNFHVTHANRFGYPKKEFQLILQNPRKSTEIVLRFLVEEIGISKPPEWVFAEYNHNFMATSVAALQKGINTLTSSKVQEDGLIGREFRKAIEKRPELFPSSLSLETIREREILDLLDFWNAAYNLSLKPFVPSVVVKKDLKFIGTILKESIVHPKRLFRVVALFERDIDLPLYVERAQKAFFFLQDGERK